MRIVEQIDGVLWRRGFINAPIRCVLRNMLLVSALLLACGIVFLPFSGDPLWVALSSIIICCNFYDISKVVQKILPASIPIEDKRGAATAAIVKKRVLFRSQIRLFFIAVFIYIALVMFHASPFALAAGFSVSVIVIPVSLLLRKGSGVKGG